MTNVLVASTNPTIVQGLQDQLRSHDFSVVAVDSAESVMVRIANSDATIAVIGEEIDCQPPGFRVSSWFRDNGGKAAVIVIGDDETQSAVDALDAGADDYVSTQTDFRELLCRIRALMRRYPAE